MVYYLCFTCFKVWSRTDYVHKRILFIFLSKERINLVVVKNYFVWAAFVLWNKFKKDPEIYKHIFVLQSTLSGPRHNENHACRQSNEKEPSSGTWWYLLGNVSLDQWTKSTDDRNTFQYTSGHLLTTFITLPK